MKNIYEIFDEFEVAKSKSDKMKVIEKNLSKALVTVLELTFHPRYQWKIKEVPDNYNGKSDLPQGMSPCQLSTELRKLYMFQEGHPTAESINDKKRNELLIQLLESLEPREAEVVMGIFKKDQGVQGLDYAFVKKAFPDLIP
jgi:hypothetical protein